MTLYDILGAAKDASHDTLKRAYRRRAKAAHPDRKGGNAEEMARVNRAWDVLGDPVRRVAYDRTGKEDAALNSQEAQVRDCLMNVFRQLLQQAQDLDYITAARATLAAARQDANNALRNDKKTEALLTARRKKVRRKSGSTNLFHALIDSELQKVRAAMDQAAAAIRTFDLALEALKDYESDAPSPQMASAYFQSAFVNSWNGGTSG